MNRYTDLSFTINWSNINNPYQDTTNYDDNSGFLYGFRNLRKMIRQYNTNYSLEMVINNYYDIYMNIPTNDVRDLYNHIYIYNDVIMHDNIYNYISSEEDRIYLSNINLIKDISDRFLQFRNRANSQEILDTYIITLSSVDLNLKKTQENMEIIINTIKILINDGAVLNINPIILPLYNGIENMNLNQISESEFINLYKIYENRGFLIDCIDRLYNITYNYVVVKIKEIFPMMNIEINILPIILNYLNLKKTILHNNIINIDLKRLLINLSNWRQISIINQLNIYTERDMRLYILKYNSKLLQII